MPARPAPRQSGRVCDGGPRDCAGANTTAHWPHKVLDKATQYGV